MPGVSLALMRGGNGARNPAQTKGVEHVEERIRCDNPPSQFQNEVKHDEVVIALLRGFS